MMIDSPTPAIARGSMLGGLLHLRHDFGFEPPTVIDVGAALGTFELYHAFPKARHVLIEPVAENEPYLAKLCAKLPRAEYLIAAVASQSGTAMLEVQPMLVHSSVTTVQSSPQPGLEDVTQDEATRSPTLRQIPAITLDQLCIERGLEPPYVLKLDVDGNEPDVLAGATEMLTQTEYAMIEVSLFNQIHPVIDQMRSHGFVIFDILDLMWRSGDRALWQADMAFVKEDSPFRQQRSYTATPEADAALDQHLQRYRDDCIAVIDAFQLTEPLDTAASYTERFNLQAVNAIAFPDWSQPEPALLQSLADSIQRASAEVSTQQTTLLISLGDADPDRANLAVSAALLELLDEHPEIDERLELTLVEPLSSQEWRSLLPLLSYRIALPVEDHKTLAASGAASLPLKS
ncbi:MAG: FkbM family methyltransferase [Kaiparowitsia implicata GSE-PSE-MK54-09C]|jgi:FkbM family methyltransferase|nr:FkbM family methyltransferase [Kaiparowitsia implicata GSE-PSE-MK54-09C]